MEHWNADERINSGNDQAIRGINFVGFWSVHPEFTRINCVQQASISTWATLVYLRSLGGSTVTFSTAC